MEKQNEEVEDVFDIADAITSRMFPAFERKETQCVGTPIKFLQYDRPADLFWHCVVESLLKSGATESQIEEVLKNTGVRKCFDKAELFEAFDVVAGLFLAELKIQ